MSSAYQQSTGTDTETGIEIRRMNDCRFSTWLVGQGNYQEADRKKLLKAANLFIELSKKAKAGPLSGEEEGEFSRVLQTIYDILGVSISGQFGLSRFNRNEEQGASVDYLFGGKSSTDSRKP